MQWQPAPAPRRACYWCSSIHSWRNALQLYLVKTPPHQRYLFPRADKILEKQRTWLTEHMDLLRLSYAGDLREYDLIDVAGQALPRHPESNS